MIFPIKIIGGAGTNGTPIAVATAAEMESILSGATSESVGLIYKYTGTTTDKYTNGNLYTIKLSGSAYVFAWLSETVSVQYFLSHCSVAPKPLIIVVGQPFGLSITADTDYAMDENSELLVTMGGATVAQSSKDKVYIASVTGDVIVAAVASSALTQLATPTIAMNSDGKTLEITDVDNATSYDVYVDGVYKTSVNVTTTGQTAYHKEGGGLSGGGVT